MPQVQENGSAPQSVLFERVGAHIGLITINRPEARNAISAAAANRIAELVREIEASPELRVGVITGAGDKAFCAGADLKAAADGNIRSLFIGEAGFAGFVQAERRKPWIAAVNGLAVGGGLEIALSCDMIVASSNASFGLPEVKLGMMALAGGLIRLPRALPRAIALELIASGQRITAERAERFGMVNAVVESGQLLAKAREIAEVICENSPFAVRESLDIARRSSALLESELWEYSMKTRERLYKSSDYKEGPRAFVEKRKPQWESI